MSDNSRFAELATELLGAKVAAQIIEEVWAAASPEVKRELADKMLKQIDAVMIDAWNVRGWVSGKFDEFAKEYLPAVRARIQERLAAELPAIVEAQVTAALPAIAARMVERLKGGY